LEWPYLIIGPTSVDVSAEAGLIAVGSLNGVYLLDAHGAHLIHHSDDTGPVSSLAFSPSGEFLAAGGQGVVHVLSSQSARILRTLAVSDLPWSKITALAFSPDGRVLASATDSQVLFWDAFEGTLLGMAEPGSGGGGEEQAIDQLVFSPEGTEFFVRLCDRYSYSGSGNCRLLLSAANAIDEFTSLPGEAEAVASTAGLTAISGLVGTRFFRGGEEIGSFNWGGQDIVLSPDGSLAAILRGWSVYVATLADGEAVAEIALEHPIDGMTFAADSASILTWRSCLDNAGEDCYTDPEGSLLSWDLATLASHSLAQVVAPFTALAYSPDATQLALRSGFGDVIVLRLPEADPLYSIPADCTDALWGYCFPSYRAEFPDYYHLEGDELRDWDIAYSPDGRYLVVGQESDSIRVFRSEDGQLFQTSRTRSVPTPAARSSLRTEPDWPQPPTSNATFASGRFPKANC